MIPGYFKDVQVRTSRYVIQRFYFFIIFILPTYQTTWNNSSFYLLLRCNFICVVILLSFFYISSPYISFLLANMVPICLSWAFINTKLHHHFYNFCRPGPTIIIHNHSTLGRSLDGVLKYEVLQPERLTGSTWAGHHNNVLIFKNMSMGNLEMIANSQ